MHLRRRLLVTSVALSLVLAACGGDESGGADGRGGGGDDVAAGSVNPADCGLDELAAADKPVEITFWHTMARANVDALKEMVRRFHASQDDVRVKLVQQPGYQENLTKYKAGLETGDLPDVIHLEETTVQVMLDSRSTMPMQACVEADGYDLSDFLPRSLAYYSTENVLRSMPWTVSNPILMFNAAAFEKAGLDVSDPPDTLEEVRSASQKIVDSGAAKFGIALRIAPYINEFLFAKSGAVYVNNGNGRDARATAAQLDSDIGLKIWTWWKQMVDDGLALNTGGAEGNIDHLLAIGNKQAAMTLEASGVLGTVRQVLESGQFPGVVVGAGALPALEPGGGVPVGDGALWIPKASSPEKRAAAWQLVKFLSAPAQQAYLSLAGGYVPIRKSASEDPQLADKWSTDPIFRVAYDQLLAGPLNDATVGSVIGDYQGVRDAVRDGLTAMLAQDKSPEEALARAQAAADAAIREYNARVGA